MSKLPINKIESLKFEVKSGSDVFRFLFEHHRRGTICYARLRWDLVAVGVAWLNPSDEFDVEKGEIVSLSKVLTRLRLYFPSTDEQSKVIEIYEATRFMQNHLKEIAEARRKE